MKVSVTAEIKIDGRFAAVDFLVHVDDEDVWIDATWIDGEEAPVDDVNSLFPEYARAARETACERYHEYRMMDAAL